jgi:hypothetical protein
LFCPQCGTQHADGANFCANCGYELRNRPAEPARQPFNWEYKDIKIPLNVEVKFRPDIEKAQGIVLGRLQEEGKHGWQAEGPTNLEDLERSGQIEI